MERRKVCAAFDEHDIEQLVMLAKLNRLKLPELMRRIVKAYLDNNGKTGIKRE
jgi:hypothetical protein